MDKYLRKGIQNALIALLLAVATSSAHAVGVIVSDVATGDLAETNFGTTFNQTGTLGEIIKFDLNSFSASSSSQFDLSIVTDTLSMTLTAPAGYLITSIQYEETGLTTTQNGVTAANGSIFVGGIPNNFPMFTGIPNTSMGTWTIGNTTLVDSKAAVDVEITNVISAIALDNISTTTISKNELVTVTVGLTAIPIPPAIWMMGAAITALVAVGRRGGQAS